MQLLVKTILTNYCIDKKTVLLVDELDRCLPEYQIKVLESLYHLLDIPNLIVVIALDKQQLECSIKSKFGEQQNTYGYLAKFIQYEIDLPTANCYEYIKQLMTFTTNQDNEDEVKNLISLMFKANEISIRECQIILNEINLVCNEIDNKGEPIVYLYWYPILVSLILLIKKINPDIYKKHFYTQREQIFEFPQEHIDLNDTPYKTFLDDIKNTPIQKILNIILSNNYGQCFMLHFINTFYPIRNISQESIANYIKRDVETIHSITYAYGEKMAHYPNLINNLIEKIKILI